MKKTYKNEQGRSMVEMLGVLVVIGVLSVAGIAGYSIAMRSHRTNEIVNAASMFYVLAKAQNGGNGPSGDIAYTALGGTNPSGATLTYTDSAFTITFTDTDDCTMAANKLGDKATADCTNNKITVNFGETTAESEENSVDCSSRTYNWEDKCGEGCVANSDTCVSPSTCDYICSGDCWQLNEDNIDIFYGCCQGAEGLKKGCPSS